MLKSCPYCGGIHDRRESCQSKPKPQWDKEPTAASNFRSTRKWRDKRKRILERDHYTCQICTRGKYNTIGRWWKFKGIQIHHAIPIMEAWDKRLDDGNLIALCSYHHHMADNGMIPRSEILEIIREQQSPPAGG